MEVLKLLQETLATGADGALIVVAVWLLRQERRIHNLEIVTGIKKLVKGDI